MANNKLNNNLNNERNNERNDKMDCTNVEELISEYIENELPRDVQQEISLHLETCESCRNVKEKIEELVYSFPELEEEVPFYLKNRLLYIPESQEDDDNNIIEMVDRSLFLKYMAAAIGGFLIMLNLFYFTNIYPAANRFLHSVVSGIETAAVRTEAIFERAQESKKVIYSSLDPEFVGIEEEEKPMGKNIDKNKKKNGGKNG